MANPILDVFKQNSYDLKVASTRSKAWFQTQVNALNKQAPNSQKILKSDISYLTTNIIPGHMYMFLYDPKLKNELPYYDAFPLVLPFAKTDDGFIGLNLHYLPYQPRAQLLSRLMEYANNSKLNDATRIKYSWGLIQGVSKFKWAEPCVKRYLYSHVKSRLRKIPGQDWTTAVLLPVEQFVGATKSTVWKDSMRY